MKIRYYAKQSFLEIEEIDISEMTYMESFKKYRCPKSWRYFSENLIFEDRKKALYFCLTKLMENKNKVAEKLEKEGKKIDKFLNKYEDEDF